MAKGKRDGLRIPPQTLESEKAFLGALMIRPEGMVETTDLISDDAFYAEKHRIIFRAALALYQKSEPIDVESVRAKLADQGLLEARLIITAVNEDRVEAIWRGEGYVYTPGWTRLHGWDCPCAAMSVTSKG